MITLKVDEAYAFDYLSILEVKKTFYPQKDWPEINECIKHIISQIGQDLFDEIYKSKEYHEMVLINSETFKLVDLAKDNKCSAKDVDIYNYKRFKAKLALQNKFFKTIVQETKIGYDNHE
jgi:hypothetical protein